MKIVVIARSDSGKILGIYEDTKSAEELAKNNGGHIEYYPCYLNSEDREEHLRELHETFPHIYGEVKGG